MAIPLLKAAQDESRDEIQELWARLLSNALDKDMTPIRRVFIDILQQLEALDAQILQKLSDMGGIENGVCIFHTKNKTDWRTGFGVTEDQFEISIENLIKLECISITTKYEELNGTSRVSFSTS